MALPSLIRMALNIGSRMETVTEKMVRLLSKPTDLKSGGLMANGIGITIFLLLQMPTGGKNGGKIICSTETDNPQLHMAHMKHGTRVHDSSFKDLCSQEWKDERGQLHRDDGPAKITGDGTSYWYQNGQSHRVDGPAVIFSHGSEHWCQHGVLHRDNDLPAVISDDGRNEWYSKGWHHRKNNPAILRPDGSQEWLINGHHHRINGPAIIKADGTREWYQNACKHRETGPAVIYPDGSQEWWVFDVLQTRKQVEALIRKHNLPPVSEDDTIKFAPDPPQLSSLKLWGTPEKGTPKKYNDYL